MSTQEEQAAAAYLESFKNPPSTRLSLHNRDNKKKDEELIRDNDLIISSSSKILRERLSAGDGSLQAKEIIQMRSDAFKQNQALLGRWDSIIDPRKLIPSVINIQVINNHS